MKRDTTKKQEFIFWFNARKAQKDMSGCEQIAGAAFINPWEYHYKQE
ncbi:MAG: hypothetical protein LBT14_11945 [Treponema sp.]|jgi:hypothetical protein|nr:hypothetical protein [Treponema sp.]